MMPRLVLLAGLVLALSLPSPAAPVRTDPRPTFYAGWAMEAYPDQSAAELEATVRRVVRAGANVVWIGHNNPGEVDAGKVEPGLSYAVYEALQDPEDPRRQVAASLVAVQHRILAACRAAGAKAVLPVGYQAQMGRLWNSRHPEAVRRDAEGRPLDIFGGGVSASFYAPAYRHDIEAYYRWIDAEFARPYADVILMLNLADEPIGGDYSAAAEAEFRRRAGFGFAEVGENPIRQRKLGEFQSRYVVEYASYSARVWQRIHPGLPVTMSFDGAQARMAFTLPDVEALFRDTPSNFVVTFDAYPRDGLPHIPVSDADLIGLFLLARSAGFYSARYGKPLWLWAAANRWGLSQASPDPGTVSDAVANGVSLALLVRQGGGDLRGIVYWNYNVREQGLYNDTHSTAYDVETMFTQVSATLPRLRRMMALPAGRPDVLILVPPAVAYERIGAAKEAIRLEGQAFPRLAILAKENANAAVVGSMHGWPLDGVKAVVVVSPGTEFLSPEDLAILRHFLRAGGKLVVSRGVAAGLPDAVGEPDRVFGDLARRWGNLYVAQQGVPALFEDHQPAVLAELWRAVLGVEALQPGYRVIVADVVFYYHRGPEPAQVSLAFPYYAAGYRYDVHASPVERLQGVRVAVAVGRREFLLLIRHVPARPNRR